MQTDRMENRLPKAAVWVRQGAGKSCWQAGAWERESAPGGRGNMGEVWGHASHPGAPLLFGSSEAGTG